jgi:isoamylase
MTDEHWRNYLAKSLAVYINGRGLHSVGPKGEPIIDDSFYVIFNAWHKGLQYKLPEARYGKEWSIVLDTTEGAFKTHRKIYKAEEMIKVKGRSITLLIHHLVQNPGTRQQQDNA